MQKCGYVTLVGAPNAGKSTLMNYLIGQKISIVSSKVQTTRSVLRGIMTEDDTQIIFIDTPGIFIPNKKRNLERAIVKCAWEHLRDSEVTCLLVDAKEGITKTVRTIIEDLKRHEKRVHLVLNKVDLAKEKLTIPLADELYKEGIFDEIFMVSAKTGRGVDKLKKFLVDSMPEATWAYSEDEITDAPVRFLASEITREKLFKNMKKDLPYAIAVETEKWEELENGVTHISQVIIVTKQSQKAIVLGKGGSMIKRIGQHAREDIEEMLGNKVFLKLFVKVQEDWKSRGENYEYMGLKLPNLRK